MTDTDVSKQIEQIKQLKRKKEEASKQVTADEAQLKVLESQRDELYGKCRELGVDPKDVKTKIQELRDTLEDNIGRIKRRFETLKQNEDGDDDEE